ncbi:hypothetical protein [Blastomonas fulva]|uniref:hypothetical protein n=1 Tax=Blastomonas fulva TaxID=1550728 RepID=UPI003F715601
MHRPTPACGATASNPGLVLGQKEDPTGWRNWRALQEGNISMIPVSKLLNKLSLVNLVVRVVGRGCGANDIATFAFEKKKI